MPPEQLDSVYAEAVASDAPFRVDVRPADAAGACSLGAADFAKIAWVVVAGGVVRPVVVAGVLGGAEGHFVNVAANAAHVQALLHHAEEIAEV